MIRRGNINDLEHIVTLLTELHDASDEAYIPINQVESRSLFLNMMISKASAVIVSENDGVLDGVMLCVTDSFFYNSKRKVATDLATYAKKPGVGAGLIKAFIKWATDKKVDRIMLGTSSNLDPERVDRLYLRVGLTKIGGLYSMKGKS